MSRHDNKATYEERFEEEHMSFRRAMNQCTLATEKDVMHFRSARGIPDAQTCPRWVACPCHHSVAERGADASRCGALQQVWGQGVYCGHCGGLL